MLQARSKIAYKECSVYEVPSEIPQRNPLLPSDDRLITEPSQQQLEWLSTMILTGQIQKIQEMIPQENKGKYYLFKKRNSNALSGGYLFKINEKRRTTSQENQDRTETTLPGATYQTYSFYSLLPSLLTLNIESDTADIYPLPDQLPTSAPKTRRFARIIDVDDKTGELTLHDGNAEQKMKFNKPANYHIIEFDPTTKKGTFISLSDFITINDSNRYLFTGSAATRIFVQKICDDTKRLYVQLEISNNEPLQGNKPLSVDETNEIENIANDVTIPDKSSCETKGHPIEKVRGPRFDPAKFTQFNTSHHNSGVQVYYYGIYYDGEGGFSSRVKVDTLFTTKDGSPACYAISLTQDQDSIPKGILTTVLFVLKDDVEAANAKSEKERIDRIEQNLTKVTGKKVGEEVYFYETSRDETSRQNPKKGKIIKINGIFNKDYDLEYSGKTINVKSIYERGDLPQKGGNKNKTRCCRRPRKHPRKSIKKKQSSRKGRKRHSIRRSRSRK